MNADDVEPVLSSTRHYDPPETYSNGAHFVKIELDPDTGRIDGMLTIQDVTKPVILDVTFNGGGKTPMSGGYSLGFHATGVLRRSDFGPHCA